LIGDAGLRTAPHFYSFAAKRIKGQLVGYSKARDGWAARSSRNVGAADVGALTQQHHAIT
jgi:hypothetical protein